MCQDLERNWGKESGKKIGERDWGKDLFPNSLSKSFSQIFCLLSELNLDKYCTSDINKKYRDGKLIIKPQKEKVAGFLRSLREILANNKTAKTESIIQLLNPMLQGFAMYYRFVVSKELFAFAENRKSGVRMRRLYGGHNIEILAKWFNWREYSMR